MSSSLWPHEPQHARPPCPSPAPGVHPNPRPLSQCCHPAISSSIILFSSRPQSFPESGSFPMSQLFASGGQNIGVSASTSVLPMNTQDWSPLVAPIPPKFPAVVWYGHILRLKRIPCGFSQEGPIWESKVSSSNKKGIGVFPPLLWLWLYDKELNFDPSVHSINIYDNQHTEAT